MSDVQQGFETGDLQCSLGNAGKPFKMLVGWNSKDIRDGRVQGSDADMGRIPCLKCGTQTNDSAVFPAQDLYWQRCGECGGIFGYSREGILRKIWKPGSPRIMDIPAGCLAVTEVNNV